MGKSLDKAHGSQTIALLPWGNVIEDFLGMVGISLEAYCTEFTGSWIFGYAEALARVGIRPVLVCVSANLAQPSRFTHRPTGVVIHVLPAPRVYRFLRRRMLGSKASYGRTVKQMFGEIHGIRLLLLPMLFFLKELSFYLSTPCRLLTRILREEGCKAILCQEYEFPRFDICVILGVLMRMPVFATFQGGNYHRCLLERFIRPLAIGASSGLIIGSQSEVQRVRTRYGISPSKIARIFNPIDLNFWGNTDRAEMRAELGLRSDARVVVWHGRISMWQKGLDILLDAWELVRSEHPGRDVWLLLVGTGHDAPMLRQRLTAMQGQNVLWVDKFIHDRATIRRYLSAGDIYAFPSRHEGFPVAPLEAMACSLPIVAAQAEGVPDILEGGESSGGLIVPRENAVVLARELVRLLDDEGWRQELGRLARRRIETSFSLEAIGKQLRSFLIDDRN